MMEIASRQDFECRYENPVRRLLALGEPSQFARPNQWPDYPADFGLGPRDINDLIRMSCDQDLTESEADQPEYWAPVHAWRCLGQLRAEDAIVPLLGVLAHDGDDDFATSELPAVFGLIGTAALPHLAEILDRRSSPMMLSSSAIESVEAIGKAHPGLRDQCVDILARMLERGTVRKAFVNGCAVAALLGLSAVEAVDTIRAAFRRKAVDITIVGDEEDVEVALGLKAVRSTPAPFLDIFGSLAATRAEKPGRNDPCACGSGKKFKKCCLE